MPYTKIGMHFMGGNDKGEGYSRLAAPTVIKLVNAFGDADKIVNLPHKPLVIGRVAREDAKPEDQILRMTPQECLDWYFGAFLQHEIDNNPAIQWWETINEPIVNIENRPMSEWIARMQWVDEYEYLSALRLRALGKKKVAFNFSVGNPAWELWQYAPKTLGLTKTDGVILGLHRYLELIRLPEGGIDYGRTVNGFWGTYHEKEIELLGQLGYMPKIAITECGLEYIGKGKGKAWKVEGITAREYATIMHLWGKRLELSPQVIGATVFTVGGAGWENYDVANTEFEKEMITYAQAGTSPVPPPPAQGLNLLVNGGLESKPDGTGWQLYVKRTSAENKNPIFRIERAESGASPLSRREGNAGGQILATHICYLAGVRQTVILPAGLYALSAQGRTWMRGDANFDFESDDGTDCSWLIRVRDAKGTLLESGIKLKGWQALSGTFAASGGQVIVEIECDMGGEQNRWPVGISALSFDNIFLGRLNVTPPPVPPPPAPEETPLFKFHGRGQWFRFYRSPNLSSDLPPRAVNWEIEVFELRPYGGPAGMWARVTRKTSKTELWMRIGV